MSKRVKVEMTYREWEAVQYAVDFLMDAGNGADPEPARRIYGHGKALNRLFIRAGKGKWK